MEIRYMGPGWYSIEFFDGVLKIMYWPEWTDETSADPGDLFQVDREALFWDCVAYKAKEMGS